MALKNIGLDKTSIIVLATLDSGAFFKEWIAPALNTAGATGFVDTLNAEPSEPNSAICELYEASKEMILNVLTPTKVISTIENLYIGGYSLLNILKRDSSDYYVATRIKDTLVENAFQLPELKKVLSDITLNYKIDNKGIVNSVLDTQATKYITSVLRKDALDLENYLGLEYKVITSIDLLEWFKRNKGFFNTKKSHSILSSINKNSITMLSILVDGILDEREVA